MLYVLLFSIAIFISTSISKLTATVIPVPVITSKAAVISANKNVLSKKSPTITTASTSKDVAKISNTRRIIKTLGPVLASSFCAAALMYPADLVRALQMANAGSGLNLSTKQLLVNFKNAHGYKGFFTQGLVPEVIKATWARFVKFSLYPIIHIAITNGVSEDKGNSVTKALAGILASIPEVWTILPLEIAKISLQLDTTNKFNNNMFASMKSVYLERGIQGFGIGYVGIQLRQSLWTAGYFASLSFFINNVEHIMKFTGLEKMPSSKAVCQLISGFLAGVFGASLNTPCDTIRSNVQKRIFTGVGRSATGDNFLSVGREIYKNKGTSGLYAGFQAKAIHLGGGGALMSYLIPFFKNIFDNV